MISYILLSVLTSCTPNEISTAAPAEILKFDSVPIAIPLQPILSEISGISESVRNQGYLWAHEDSGNPPHLYLIAKDGKVFKKIVLKGAENRDWEDIALSNGNLYIADIGDNNSQLGTYYLYKFPEPSLSCDTLSSFDKISFQYPDGNHDAEALVIDPVTEDIYIFTKRDNPSRLYKIPHGYSTNKINNAIYITNLATSGIVSAALSQDGNALLLKTYFSITLFTKSKNQSFGSLFSQKPSVLSYRIEPQGEAVCFSNSRGGFYTLSEKGFGTNVYLYYYPLLK